jgi:hypothetical protein
MEDYTMKRCIAMLLQLVALFVCLIESTPADAQSLCTPASVQLLPGSWKTTADATSGAFEWGMPRAELPAALSHLDVYAAMIKTIMGPPTGYDGIFHRVVGFEPQTNRGPQPHSIQMQVDGFVCSEGKVAGTVFRAKVTFEINRLWNLFTYEQTLNGKKIYLTGFPLGDIQGAPLFESPYRTADDLMLYRWTLVIARSGELPFRNLTRREVLDELKPHLLQMRKDKVADADRIVKVRPAEAQEKEKQEGIAEIRKERAGDPAGIERGVKRFLEDYRTDEQKREELRSKLTNEVDRALARVEALRVKYAAGGGDQPATLPDGGAVTILRDAQWDFPAPNTDRNHYCNVDCNHGMLVSVLNDAYWSKARQRSDVQVVSVVFDWTALMKDKGRRPFSEALRDTLFDKIEVNAIRATLAK